MTTPTEVKHLFNEDQIVSANAYFDAEIDGESVRLQVTARFGSTPQTIADQIKALIEGYKLARQLYPRSTSNPAPTVEQGEKKYEAKPVSTGDLPEGLPEGIEVFREDFDEIEITPQPDDKVTVTFLRDGMKFPVGAKINKWKIGNVAQSLTALGEYDFTKAQKIRVAGSQYYSKGSEYIIAQGAHKGEKSHYKDRRLVIARF